MKDNFDVHKWNYNRYLKEAAGLDIDQSGGTDNVNQDDEAGSLNITRGGDDPKIGAELESGAIGDRVAENKDYLESLVLNLTQAHPDLRFEVSDFDDIRVYGSQQDLADFGRKMHGEKFGEYEVFHVDDDDRGEIVRIVKSDSIMRNENLNEASYMYRGYEDKHFDICPTAENLRDRLKSGEFGQPDELDLGEWLYQHDVLFLIEKQVIKDGEGDISDFDKAREAANRIINLSRDLGIPGSELGYLKDHLDLIKDMIDYSALTEKDKFAGSDPKAGSTIKGTGFMAPRQKSKDREAIKETLRFIKENNPEFTNEEIKAELKEIKELGKQLNEKLCKKGEAYRKRRMAAGEKSSAYLSGRAVKVCKGQMSGKSKKKK